MVQFKLSSLGGGTSGSQPRNGLLGGGANSNGGSGMDGGQTRAIERKVLRNSFGNRTYNTTSGPSKYQLTGTYATTPFRVAMNAGDVNGTYQKPVDTTALPKPSNQVHVTKSSLFGWKLSAGSVKTIDGGSAYSGNPKYVYDGTDYVRFKKLQAIKRNYNDKSFGGDNNFAAQVPRSNARR